MYNPTTEIKKMSRRQKLLNLAVTIKHLEGMINKNKQNPIDAFLQKEVVRLMVEEQKLKKSVKSK